MVTAKRPTAIRSGTVWETVPQIPLPVALDMTEEEFEGVYNMWKVGANYCALAEAHGLDPYVLAWCFLMRREGDCRIHYRPPN